jgi:hypothetical protein
MRQRSGWRQVVVAGVLDDDDAELTVELDVARSRLLAETLTHTANALGPRCWGLTSDGSVVVIIQPRRVTRNVA